MSGLNFSVGNNSLSSIPNYTGTKKSVNGRLSYVIFLIIGLVFVGIGAFMLNAANKA